MEGGGLGGRAGLGLELGIAASSGRAGGLGSTGRGLDARLLPDLRRSRALQPELGDGEKVSALLGVPASALVPTLRPRWDAEAAGCPASFCLLTVVSGSSCLFVLSFVHSFTDGEKTIRSRLNGGPQKDTRASLETVNVTFFGKRVFADVIKDLEMRLPCIIWVALKSNDECPYKTKGCREEEVMDGGEDERDVAPSQPTRSLRKLEAERNRPFPRASGGGGRGHGPAATLISDFWAPELGEDIFLLFQASKFGILCYRTHRKQIQLK